MSSVMFTCNEPTYSFIGPICGNAFAGFPPGPTGPGIRFFSAWVGFTKIGTPSKRCPLNPIALFRK